MNNNKKNKIILSIIAFFSIAFLIGLSIFFTIGLSLCHLIPLPDKTFTKTNFEISRNNESFICEKLEVKVKKISRDEYKNHEYINVFYDYIYDVYYKIEATIYKDNKEYKADVFCNHANSDRFYRPVYYFDIMFDNKKYEKAFIIKNYGSFRPSLGRLVW